MVHFLQLHSCKAAPQSRPSTLHCPVIAPNLPPVLAFSACSNSDAPLVNMGEWTSPGGHLAFARPHINGLPSTCLPLFFCLLHYIHCSLTTKHPPLPHPQFIFFWHKWWEWDNFSPPWNHHGKVSLQAEDYSQEMNSPSWRLLRWLGCQPVPHSYTATAPNVMQFWPCEK